MELQRWLKLVVIGLAMLLIAPGLAFASESFSSGSGETDTFFTPQRHQFDLTVGDSFQFVDPGSIVRRNNFRDAGAPPGSALHLSSDLGLSTLQLVGLRTTFWFDHNNAVQLQSRYYVNYGAAGLHQMVFFNGDKITPNQLLSTGGTRWFAFDLLYQRRLTAWYEGKEDNLPRWLQGWDTRGSIGLEFVYLDFRIRDGHPKFASDSGRFLARGRFHERELPLPTIGLEARRRLYGKFNLEITGQGNWANKWDSFRSEGGTVYLSQASFETHWRVVYDNPDWMWKVRPYVGADYIYYKQVADSGLVKDFIRTQMYGPEAGFTINF